MPMKPPHLIFILVVYSFFLFLSFCFYFNSSLVHNYSLLSSADTASHARTDCTSLANSVLKKNAIVRMVTVQQANYA